MAIYDRYINVLQRRKRKPIAESTIANYKSHIQGFSDYMNVSETDGLDSLTTKMYRDYTVELLKTLKPSSVNNRIRSINAFLNWLLDVEEITNDSLPEMNFVNRRTKFYEEDVKDSLYLEDDVLDAMQDACVSVRDKVILATMRYTGCRVREVADMRLRDIEEYTNKMGESKYKILLPKTKGDKPRYVGLFQELVLEMQKIVEKRDDGHDFIFVGSRGVSTGKPISTVGVSKLVKRVGSVVMGHGVGKTIHPHLWRKAFTTERLKLGFTMQQVGLALGHSPVSSKNSGGQSVTNSRYNLTTNSMAIDMKIFEAHPIRI